MTTDSPDAGVLAVTERDGIYLVTTLTGSAYVINFQKMTATRNPNPYDEDQEKKSPQRRRRTTPPRHQRNRHRQRHDPHPRHQG